jgi:hypothetical protein
VANLLLMKGYVLENTPTSANLKIEKIGKIKRGML